MAKIQRKIVKQGKRNALFRALHAKNEKYKIAAWRRDLVRVLHVFNVRSVCSVLHSLLTPSQTELAINTHVMVADIHRKALTGAIEATTVNNNQ